MKVAQEPGIDRGALRRLIAREDDAFLKSHRESARLAASSAVHWLNGVPMH